MYKTISIHHTTYQQLHTLAAKLQKPKSQVVDELIKSYIDNLQEQEKNALKNFNSSVRKLSKQIKLPKNTQLTTNELDAALTELHDKSSE